MGCEVLYCDGFCAMNKWARPKQFIQFISSRSYSGKLVKVDYNSIVRMYMIVFASLSCSGDAWSLRELSNSIDRNIRR